MLIFRGAQTPLIFSGSNRELQQVLGRGRDKVRFGSGSPTSQETRKDCTLRAWVKEKGQVCQGCEGKAGMDNRTDDAKSHI